MNGAGFFDLKFVMAQWQAAGMFDVLLPLLLVFVIVYAILHESGLFGKHKSIDAIIGLIVALFTASNPFVATLFAPIFSQAGLAIIILVAIALIMGVFLTKDKMSKTYGTVLSIFGVALFLWLISRMAESFGIWTLPIQTFFWNWMPIIIPVVMFLAAIIFVMADKSGTGGGAAKPGST